MIRNSRESARRGGMSRLLRSGASVLAIGVVAIAAPAYAQDEAQQDEPTITVTGIRASLANSQNIKRNSDTVVDAITASDIGALPDRSVTEALQRVPGVSMNRFAGSNDPDHFSVEGSGVVVRGLNFVRSEFNGRDTFSAGVYGQAINFSDVPAELLGSVEVYKNATSAMVEGGLAGTVNLNTRVPFDNKGFHLAFDAEANYGDMSKKWSPTGSIMISDTFDTGIGTIGVLANLSYSRLLSRADGVQVSNFQTRDNVSTIQSSTGGIAICRNPLPGDTDTRGLPPGGSASPPAGQACPGNAQGSAGADTYADYAGTRYAPVGGQFRTSDYDRERTGVAAAFQWESLDRRAVLTAQFLRTDSTNKWGEHTYEAGSDLSEYNTYPYGCQQNGDGPSVKTNNNTGGTVRALCPVGGFRQYQYDSNGVFEKGYITLPGGGWRSNDSGGSGRTTTGGMQHSLSRRQVDEENIVADYGLNFKFSPDDHWVMNFDADYTMAQHDQLDMSAFGSIFADQELDLTGDLPIITPHKPLTLSAAWATPNPAIAGSSDAQYFNNPAFQLWRAAMDHIEHSTGSELALRGDIGYKFNDDSFLKQIKFGARYADRQQTIRYTTYNWGRTGDVFGNNGPQWMDATPNDIARYNFPDFFRGQTKAPPGAFYYNKDLIQGYPGAADFFEGIATAGGSGGWTRLSKRNGVIAGTPYLPNEIQDVDQTNYDGYGMLSFGSDDLFGGVRVSGNIGLRYVRTDVRSAGSVFITKESLGVDQLFSVRCADPLATPNPNLPPGVSVGGPGGICNLGAVKYAELQLFASGSPTPNVANTQNEQWLPSLNLKFDLSDRLVMRFAASKVMSLPDMASIRNSFSANFNTQDSTVTFNLGNPYLKPVTAKQFDATLEWYFARVGSLTFDAFYKEVSNFFYAQVATRSFTQNGITEDITVRLPQNYNGVGKIKGFEVAYQQTFDFLPWIFSGLGMNASYTYIESSGLPNSFLNTGAPSNTARVGTGTLPLEQLSKHTVNVQAFYEKGPVSLRVAYNWRSRFLLTAADVIFPYDPIFQAASGSMDASVFINLNSQVKIGVQGVNLLNTITKTEQQFTPEGLVGPRSYFMNDRRFSFILRGNF